MGLADLACCVLELVTLTLAIALLRESTWTRRPNPPASHVPRLALVALVAATAAGLAGTQFSWVQVLVAGMEHSG